MGKTYEFAPDEVFQKLHAVLANHHHALMSSGIKIDILKVSDIDSEGVVHPALLVRGHAAIASVAISPLKARALGQADALIVLDSYSWDEMGDLQRDAVLDHELEHLQVRADPRGVVGWDPNGLVAIGRPKASPPPARS